MAFTEFCCRSGGSNLNAGTRTGNSTEPGTSADFTYASGNWVASTGVFTVASGNPSSDGVAVGDFASVYADGSTVTGFVGRVTARDTTTITVSLTAKSGTAPTDGTGTRTLKVGGAWQGPNGTSGFPLGWITGTLTNSSGDYPRVNLKNSASFSITAAITQSYGNFTFQGYSSSYGDGSRAIIDGGTSGSSYILISWHGGSTSVRDMIFQNNGATSNSNGIITNFTDGVIFDRCVFKSLRGYGLSSSATVVLSECEFYSCGQAGSCGGWSNGAPGSEADRCIFHDNSASGNVGATTTADASYTNCIFDTNASHGLSVSSGSQMVFRVSGCDFYNNSGSGISYNTQGLLIENSNFLKNGAYGIVRSAGNGTAGIIRNCAFGSGTQANTSGTTSSLQMVDEIGSITYSTNLVPWVDPANGDFRINLAAAKGTGRGSFTQTASSYTGSIGYPDVGSAQHADAGGGLIVNPGVVGGWE